MRVLILAFWLFVAFPSWAQEIPAPQGYVSDYAEVLSSAMREQLTALLVELEQKTTAQIAVLIVKTTQPLDEFQYGVKVFDSWKIGQKGKDNGALFLVAVKDRRVRILTGYGLEGILPDGKVGAILDEFVLPEFREGRFDEGIYKGVWAVALVIAKDASVELTGQAPVEIDRLPDGVSPMSLVIALVIIFLVASFLMRSARRQRGRSGFPWWLIWLAMSSGGKSSSRGSSGSFSGGFSRGSFGGFGGGRTGGGGAGRGW